MTIKDQEPMTTLGSGNVFEDLGLPDSRELLIKASIASAISDAIENKGLKQAEAGELMGIPQSHVSNIMRGRLEGFSIERLIRLLNMLDLDVQMSFVPIRQSA